MRHAFKFRGEELSIDLSRAAAGYRLHIDGQQIPIDLRHRADGSLVLSVLDCSEAVVVAAHGDDIFIHLDGQAYQLTYLHPLDRLEVRLQAVATNDIRAPMPGSLVAINVRAGDRVRKGETLLVMESMKMETNILAPRDGVVSEPQFEVGQPFERDALLVRLSAVDGDGEVGT